MSDGIGFLTPDFVAGDVIVTRAITLPAFLLPYVGGVLSELSDPSNWVAFGDMSVEDVAATFADIMDNAVDT